jgi:hypothetical protein
VVSPTVLLGIVNIENVNDDVVVKIEIVVKLK